MRGGGGGGREGGGSGGGGVGRRGRGVTRAIDRLLFPQNSAANFPLQMGLTEL